MTPTGLAAREIRAVSVRLAREPRIEVLLTDILAASLRVFGASSGRILTIQRNGRSLAPMASLPNEARCGIENDPPILLHDEANRFNLTDPHVYCIVTGEITIIEDVNRFSRFDLSGVRALVGGGADLPSSVILVPLWSAGSSTLGVLQLISPATAILEAGGPSPDHEESLLAFASLAAAALSNMRLQDENRGLARQLDRRDNEMREHRSGAAQVVPSLSRHLIGDSPSFKNCLAYAQRAANSNVPVLLLGETGTGKDVLARAIHAMSDRRAMPFIAQNCAAIPENLLESELFGHARGAFTGATTDKKGLIQEAVGGVLFLDEIGDLPVALQAKLLRFLEDGIVRRLGENRGQLANVRLIAATNADLAEKIEAGLFREDLFYRLNVFPILLPPLRDRQEDVPLLIEHFLTNSAKALGRPVPLFGQSAIDALLGWHFPGNIRELRNIIERALLLVDDGERLEINHLPTELRRQRFKPSAIPVAPLGEGQSLKQATQDFEAMLITARLTEAGWNQSKAARLLQISRRSLVEKLTRYSIRRNDKGA
ncbi:RocR Transcriptional regulator containing PAS, AAA-type ATPase, and DNA-binding domains [Rhabdaerophilaceae bacterium]